MKIIKRIIVCVAIIIALAWTAYIVYMIYLCIGPTTDYRSRCEGAGYIHGDMLIDITGTNRRCICYEGVELSDDK